MMQANPKQQNFIHQIAQNAQNTAGNMMGAIPTAGRMMGDFMGQNVRNMINPIENAFRNIHPQSPQNNVSGVFNKLKGQEDLKRQQLSQINQLTR